MADPPRPISVLVVEDNLGDVLMIRQALAGAGIPITIRVAVDGKQAMEILIARDFTPDLVILDLNIPKLSGLAVLERCHIDAPVVVFSSSSDPRDRQSSFELGAKDYVQKPTDLAEYRETVSQMVRSWANPAK
jgi:CheY-like chemotaxis protein